MAQAAAVNSFDPSEHDSLDFGSRGQREVADLNSVSNGWKKGDSQKRFYIGRRWREHPPEKLPAP